MRPARAITVHQPWATLIAQGRKTLEARARPTSYRGPLAIHAGLAVHEGAREAVALCEEQGEIPRYTYPAGALVAVVELVDCRPWRTGTLADLCADLDAQEGALFELPATLAEGREALRGKGAWLWVLRDARPLPRPLPCRGQQGLWAPPPLSL